MLAKAGFQAKGLRTSTLTVRREDLQRLLVTERDEDLDAPLVVVDVLGDPDLTDETESCSEQCLASSRKGS